MFNVEDFDKDIATIIKCSDDYEIAYVLSCIKGFVYWKSIDFLPIDSVSINNKIANLSNSYTYVVHVSFHPVERIFIVSLDVDFTNIHRSYRHEIIDNVKYRIIKHKTERMLSNI